MKNRKAIVLFISLMVLVSCGGESRSDRKSVDFNDLLRANKLQSSVHIIPEVAHSYIGETAQSTKEASILALEMSLAFIDKVFK